MLKKIAVVLLGITVLGAGSGIYFWEKNKGVISQLEELERSIFIEPQEKVAGLQGGSRKVDSDKADNDKANNKDGRDDRSGIAGRVDQADGTDDQAAKGAAGAGKISGQPGETTGNIQKKVSVNDRAEVIALVMRRLSTADISRLKRLAQGGVTPQKKREAKAIILSRFSSAEINRLKEIYRKYE